MKSRKLSISTVDEYIEQFPKNVQKLLRQMRAAVKKAAPQATERISYQMPTYTMKKNLVHFAGYRNHIGFYPTASDLITRIVKFRVGEDRGRGLRVLRPLR